MPGQILPPPPRGIEQLEYERVTTALEPVVKTHQESMSPLLTPKSAGMVLIASLVHQAARVAVRIGLSRGELEARVNEIAGKVYVRRVETPKVIV